MHFRETGRTWPTMSDSSMQTLVLGGGCFWCVEAVYKMIPGVVRVESGYAGGKRERPGYEQICSGATGHAEVVKITFDPAVTDLRTILDWFWQAHDPTTLNRQGADVGTQYRSVIFFQSPEQKAEAEASRDAAQTLLGKHIVTEISPMPVFWPAESYHQDYFANNPGNSYCAMVVRPKVEKVRKKLADPNA